jgi:hypothetical protein
MPEIIVLTVKSDDDFTALTDDIMDGPDGNKTWSTWTKYIYITIIIFIYIEPNRFVKC